MSSRTQKRNHVSGEEFDSLWNDIRGVFDILFKPLLPSHDEGTGAQQPAVRISTAQYTLAYSALFRLSNHDLVYERLDEYLKSVLNDVVSKIEGDTGGAGCLERYLLEYTVYTGALRPMCNICSIVDRYFITRERDEGKGWIELHHRKYPQERAPSREPGLAARERALVRHWGLPKKFSKQEFKDAERRAEIATELDCVIGVTALGLKRWRTHVFTALLEPKDGMVRGLISAAALDNLLTDKEANRTELLGHLQESLEEVGVQSEHPFMEELVAVVKQVKGLTVSGQETVLG